MDKPFSCRQLSLLQMVAAILRIVRNFFNLLLRVLLLKKENYNLGSNLGRLGTVSKF